MIGYEKIDRCDNKLKLSKLAVKSIYRNYFQKKFLGFFSETLTIKLPRSNFWLIWVQASLEKKGFSYGGLPFKLYSAAFGECELPFL